MNLDILTDFPIYLHDFHGLALLLLLSTFTDHIGCWYDYRSIFRGGLLIY